MITDNTVANYIKTAEWLWWREAAQRTGGRVSAMCVLAGVDRRTVARRLKALGINRKDFANADRSDRES